MGTSPGHTRSHPTSIVARPARTESDAQGELMVGTRLKDGRSRIARIPRKRRGSSIGSLSRRQDRDCRRHLGCDGPAGSVGVLDAVESLAGQDRACGVLLACRVAGTQGGLRGKAGAG